MPGSSYVLGYVQPNGQSNQRLSAGVYSLSARSNVPFARLVGKSVDKTFTWGEIVEVPIGELCTVVNASWHAGDLFINSGCDYDNRPKRITVPVQYSLIASGPLTGLWGPAFPGDVRMARRAYLAMDASGSATLASQASIVGQRFDGSHNTSNELDAAVGFAGSGYLDGFEYTALEFIGLVPLGHLANNSEDGRPHTLLTVASAYFTGDIVPTAVIPPATTPNAYYVMEY